MAHQVETGEKAVIGKEIGRVRLITLNQPHRLNIISLDVLTLLGHFLEKWEKDDDAQLILIKGSGRAFSAGGDLKLVYDARTTTMDPFLEWLYRIHWLTYHIHTYKKTQVALIHGICIGGGLSIGVPMKFSVVTEKTVFATPEARNGYHPGSGVSHILSRIPGHLGEFLALTGTRLKGTELVAAGLATHFVPSEKLGELENRLVSLNTGEENAVRSTIEEFSVDIQMKDESVLNKRVVIDECFSKDSVEEILLSLEAEARKVGSGWVVGFIKDLKRSSPTALKIALESIRRERKLTLVECLKTDFRISMNILRTMMTGDVYEGIRAVAIDKDSAPKWDPPTLEAVHADNINLVFQPLDGDLEINIPVGEDLRWEGKYKDSSYARKDFLRSTL